MENIEKNKQIGTFLNSCVYGVLVIIFSEIKD